MESYLTAEISAAALRANLSLLRGCIGPGVQLCAVVKANCYGHGLDLLLPTLSQEADCLAVATPDEACRLRDAGHDGPVLVFFSACAYADGAERREALAELVARGVTLTVVSAPEVQAVSEAARRVRMQAQVHVKIDTGMSRSGAMPPDAPPLLERLREAGDIRLSGVYTHLPTADEADKTFCMEQLQIFRDTVHRAVRPNGLTLHAANSAATIDLPQTHMRMVRPGIALYGYQPSEQMLRQLPLRPVLRLTGRLMQVKHVPRGAMAGYGLTYVFGRDSRVGLVPVGYGDGYFRCLGNRAEMMVRGRPAPIRGRVSMDQVIIDLTDIPDARVGDEVEIMSSDPRAPHSVANLARLAGTIPYELTCRLGPRVRRVLVD